MICMYNYANIIIYTGLLYTRSYRTNIRKHACYIVLLSNTTLLLYCAISLVYLCLHISVLIGTVLNSIKEGHSYRHKVRVQYYLRYNGCQDPRYLRTPVCPGKQPKWWQDQEFATDMLTCQGPEFIEVIEKCKLVKGERYLISGNGWHNPETSLSMHLCCAETPHKQPFVVYKQHLKNHSCCRFDR